MLKPASTTHAAHWHTDLYSQAMRTGRGPLFLRRTDGWLLPLDVERWCQHVDETDSDVISRCHGPVIDIGCGPGRFAAALATHGHTALGIDINAAAVERTKANGGQATKVSVFDELPLEGRWATALLMDGNIGIGGDPISLLQRIASIVCEDGILIVETAAVDVDERVTVHVDDGHGPLGDAFAWARVGTQALVRLAPTAGWTVAEQWHQANRRFIGLKMASSP